MFTGLIDAVGTLEGIRDTAAGREFTVRAPYEDVRDGESVAVNGACFTVLQHEPGRFRAAAVVTTLGRTAVAGWRDGDRVNLERSLRAGDRLGGHMVQGHVDGVGTVLDVWREQDALLADIAVDADLSGLMVPHGSVAVDGVSLTVNELPRDGVLQISLIEFTRDHTTLGGLRPGQRVHVEGDVIGKYVRRLLAPYGEVR